MSLSFQSPRTPSFRRAQADRCVVPLMHARGHPSPFHTALHPRVVLSLRSRPLSTIALLPPQASPSDLDCSRLEEELAQLDAMLMHKETGSKPIPMLFNRMRRCTEDARDIAANASSDAVANSLPGAASSHMVAEDELQQQQPCPPMSASGICNIEGPGSAADGGLPPPPPLTEQPLLPGLGSSSLGSGQHGDDDTPAEHSSTLLTAVVAGTLSGQLPSSQAGSEAGEQRTSRRGSSRLVEYIAGVIVGGRSSDSGREERRDEDSQAWEGPSQDRSEPRISSSALAALVADCIASPPPRAPEIAESNTYSELSGSGCQAVIQVQSATVKEYAVVEAAAVMEAGDAVERSPAAIEPEDSDDDLAVDTASATPTGSAAVFDSPAASAIVSDSPAASAAVSESPSVAASDSLAALDAVPDSPAGAATASEAPTAAQSPGDEAPASPPAAEDSDAKAFAVACSPDAEALLAAQSPATGAPPDAQGSDTEASSKSSPEAQSPDAEPLPATLRSDADSSLPSAPGPDAESPPATLGPDAALLPAALSSDSLSLPDAPIPEAGSSLPAALNYLSSDAEALGPPAAAQGPGLGLSVPALGEVSTAHPLPSLYKEPSLALSSQVEAAIAAAETALADQPVADAHKLETHHDLPIAGKDAPLLAPEPEPAAQPPATDNHLLPSTDSFSFGLHGASVSKTAAMAPVPELIPLPPGGAPLQKDVQPPALVPLAPLSADGSMLEGARVVAMCASSTGEAVESDVATQLAALLCSAATANPSGDNMPPAPGPQEIEVPEAAVSKQQQPAPLSVDTPLADTAGRSTSPPGSGRAASTGRREAMKSIEPLLAEVGVRACCIPLVAIPRGEICSNRYQSHVGHHPLPSAGCYASSPSPPTHRLGSSRLRYQRVFVSSTGKTAGRWETVS